MTADPAAQLGTLGLDELRGRLAREPDAVVFLVLGAIEAHGPHLPVETDTLIGVHLAHEAAAHLEAKHGTIGLVAEPITATAASCAAAFPGTVSVDPGEESRTIVERVRALVGADAERVCLVTLHFDPDHVTAVDRALDALEPDERARVVYPRLTERSNAQRIGGEFATGSCHGGQFETSLLLVAAPDRVDPSYKKLESNMVDLVGGIRAGKRSFAELGMPQAYCGRPAQASVGEGRRLYDVLAAIVVEALVPEPEEEL